MMGQICVMLDAYENALRTVADAYEAEQARWGGKSLSRVATIVASSGAFFIRLREGKTFSVANLERFASWFRQPSNWPDRKIPHPAALALASIGRPPVSMADMTHTCVMTSSGVASDRVTISHSGDA